MVRRNIICSNELGSKPKKQNQRDRILEIAKDLFRKQGYSETSLDDISKVGSINKAIIYYHFKKKADIIYEIGISNLKSLINRSTPIINSKLSSEQKLEKFILGHLNFELSNEGTNGIGPVQMKRFLPVNMFRSYVALRDQYESNLRQVLNEICDNNLDARLTSRLAFGMLTTVRTWYKQRGTLSKAQVAKAIYTILMNGIRHKII